MKTFEDFRRFSRKISANCVFRPNAQNWPHALLNCEKTMLQYWIFSNFLKKNFHNFWQFFAYVLKICWKFFWIFFENFLKIFENFLKIFLKKCSPRKNPGYAHALNPAQTQRLCKTSILSHKLWKIKIFLGGGFFHNSFQGMICQKKNANNLKRFPSINCILFKIFYPS